MVQPTSGKILIVDDSPDLRILVARFLEGQGFATAQAKNGKAALEYISLNPLPAVVLLDLEMEVMDGREFLEELERSYPHFRAPIVVLSGVERFKHPLVQRFLKKPFDLDKLERAVLMALPAEISEQNREMKF